MTNYLYEFYHKILLYPFNKVKHIHQIIKQIDDKNVFTDFIEWFLDVLQYGFVAEFIRATFFGYTNFKQSLLLCLAFGMVKWLWQVIVKETVKAIKE